ncbi:MAG TPA: glycine betaine ABC transporter substrate-binding protein [Caldimonas sp.]|nr:glycine betaine ABC transporter substrate-binding protein [Caldimonas sp.]
MSEFSYPMSMARALRWAALLALMSLAMAAQAAEPWRIGSKRFTESYVLGEVVRQTLERQGVAAIHQQGLGNTGILERALEAGAIDLYPEYTGTIVREILKREGNPSLAQLNEWLAPRGLKAAVPLGFNDTYALAMREDRAAALGIRTISDLARAPADLRAGLSHEFLQRADGWPALKAAYHLPLEPGSGIDHGLAYEAIEAGRVDLIDAYSTDAKIGRYRLRVLEDDRGFFPRYEAVLLMRTAIDPAPLRVLEGRIDASTMIALNAKVELDGLTFTDAARGFVESLATGAAFASSGARTAADAQGSSRSGLWQRTFAPDFARLLAQHLLLVFGSLAGAVVVGVPLGIGAWRWRTAAPVLLGAVAALQTVPSLALLAVLIAMLGTIGFGPALVALFLYALLPIVRNTHAGLQGVPRGLAHAALSLGLTPPQTLRTVQLPLALPIVLAGVKTAAVINVGTATLAAFVGAGGFGERIVAGLAVNDTQAMLAGALPSAALALAVQGAFEVIERSLVRGRMHTGAG